MQPNKDKRVLLGKLGAVYGVKGWIKVTSDTQPKQNIFNYANWQLKINNQWQSCELEAGRPHGKTLVVKIVGCDDRDQAQKLVGTPIAVNRSELPETKEDEYYWSDLIGMTVINQQGTKLGQVKDIMETGSNDVLVVKNQTAKIKECLIPWLEDDVIKNVNTIDRKITVSWDPEF